MSRLHQTLSLSSSAVALTAGLLLCGPAAAQTASSIEIGLDFGITAIGSGLNDENSASFIVSVVGSFANSSNVVTQLHEIATDLTLGGADAVIVNLHSSSISAVARGNAIENRIGVLPGAPPAGLVDGAAIISTQVEREGAVNALTNLNEVRQKLLFDEPGSASASLSLNSILADNLYNAALSSIEVVAPTNLQAPAQPASWDDDGTVEVALEGSLSVANTQITGFFDSPDAPVPGFGTASAATANSTIEMFAGGDPFLGGNFKLVDNSIAARSGGNRSDNSILVQDSIATEEGTLQGDPAFRGTAIVYNLQNVDDTRDEDGDFLGQGINALLYGSAVRAIIGGAGLDQDLAPLDSLAVLLEGNELSASTQLNTARNEIGFARTLLLEGTGTPLDLSLGEESVLLQERLGLRDADADYVIVSRQSANRRESFDPVAYAHVSQVAVWLEALSQASTVSMELSENSIGAQARGNLNDNILSNLLPAVGAGTPSVAATAAMLNWQWVSAPEIEATVAGDSVILARTTFGPPDGSDLDQAVALVADANSISAVAQGNRGTNLLQVAAVDVALQLGTEGDSGPVENAGAALLADRGATNAGDTFSASGGGTLANYQVLDSAADDHGDDDFLEPGIRATVGGAAIILDVKIEGPRGEDDAVTYHIEASDQLLEARATGNSYSGQAALLADAAFAGSLGLSSTQINNDQSVDSTLASVQVGVVVDLDDLGDADLAGQVELDGSRLISVATINSASQAAALDAVVMEGGGWRSDYDPLVPASSLGGLIEGYEFNVFRVTRHTSSANAAVAILNDQTSDEGDALATAANAAVVVDMRGSDPVPLTNQAVALTGSTIAAQSRFNDASNAIILDIATLATVDQFDHDENLVPTGGPLAGIVSYQGSGQGYELEPDEDPLPERESESTARVIGGGIAIYLPGIIHGEIELSGNLMAASAAGNVVGNLVRLDAVDLDTPLGVSPFSAILENDNDSDFDVAVVASFYIANTQRNEFQLFGGGPGPDITAFVGGSTISIVTESEFLESVVSLSNNAIVAEARANVGENIIALDAVTIESSAHIVSRQGNNGNVTATIEDAAILLELNAAPDGTDAMEVSAASFDNNTLQSLALGNAVLNDVSANAAGAFQGASGNAAVINEQLPATKEETTVEADYVILNRQNNAGTEEQPIEITSTVTGATLSLTVQGNFDGSSVSAQNNNILSQAVGNIAMNTVTVTAGGGDMPSSAVVNQQSNSFANITATASGNNLGMTFNGTGLGSAVTSGTFGVGATAVGNSATNTMTSRSGPPGGNGS